jgi:beta-lactamase regulating signal transducer with metallopeptidase domain
MTPHLLLESALRASLLGAGVWVLLRVLRNRSSAREWMIWLAVLAAALLMPIVSPYASGLFQDSVRHSSTPSIVSRITGVSGDVPSPGAVWRDMLRNTAALLWPIYLSIAGLLIGRLCFGLFLMRRMWHAAIPVPALSHAGTQVRATDRIDAPVVVASGILLPADWDTWSPQTLACVLMHERSHLTRKDFHWQVLTQLHVALFWVSPFAWWLLRRISLLAEYLSDEAVVAAYGRPMDYAEVLLRFAGARRTALPSVGMARRAALSQRIERLLSTQQRDMAQRQSSGFVLLGVAAIAATSVANPWFRIELPTAERQSIVARSGSTDGQYVSPSSGTSPAQPSAPSRVAVALAPLTLRIGIDTRHTQRLSPPNTARIAPPDTDQIAPLNAARITPLNTDQVAPLNTARMVPLNTDQMVPLNTDQMAPLNTARMARLNTAEIRP